MHMAIRIALTYVEIKVIVAIIQEGIRPFCFVIITYSPVCTDICVHNRTIYLSTESTKYDSFISSSSYTSCWSVQWEQLSCKNIKRMMS